MNIQRAATRSGISVRISYHASPFFDFCSASMAILDQLDNLSILSANTCLLYRAAQNSPTRFPIILFRLIAWGYINLIPATDFLKYYADYSKTTKHVVHFPLNILFSFCYYLFW